MLLRTITPSRVYASSFFTKIFLAFLCECLLLFIFNNCILNILLMMFVYQIFADEIVWPRTFALMFFLLLKEFLVSHVFGFGLIYLLCTLWLARTTLRYMHFSQVFYSLFLGCLLLMPVIATYPTSICQVLYASSTGGIIFANIILYTLFSLK